MISPGPVASERLEDLLDLVGDVFALRDVTALAQPPGGVRLRGEFLVPSDKAYRTLAPRFGVRGYTVLFRQEGERPTLILVPGLPSAGKDRHWLNLLLLVVTLLSTLWVGATLTATSMEEIRQNPLIGWPFALSLMAILGAHELSHYFMSRRFGVSVTLPYFIPMPFGPFGTMGAFINMRTPPPNRRAALLIGSAGPLGGLVVAIPVLILGLKLSTVAPLPAGEPYWMEGNSLLYAVIKALIFGQFLPANGLDVLLHPVAFAGWAGLLVTGLNLIPAGQLDGGHIVASLLGDRARTLTFVLVGGLILLGFVWQGWYLWAFLVYLFGRRRAIPLDDVTRLGATGGVLAGAMILLFLLLFTPIPLEFFA
ncbi:MAG: site-2 protease family protein [Anaerolineae bacterium]